MSQRFLPKIKVETVKKIAQQFTVTKSGKKVSATALKKFLREDEDLKHLTYASKTAKMSKVKAEKALGRVFEKLGSHERYRPNPIAARQAGLRLSQGGKLSSVGLKKIYSYAAEAQVKAEGPRGPTPEELAKQARREKAIQTMRHRGRADEMRKEQQKADAKKAAPTPAGQAGFRSVPIMQGVGFGSSGNIPVPVQPAVTPSPIKFSRRAPLRVAFLPVSNVSGSSQLEGFSRRLDQMFRRLPKRFPNLVAVNESVIADRLEAIDWQDGRSWDLPSLKRSAEGDVADVFCFGEIQRALKLVLVNLSAYLPKRNETISLASAKETLDRLSELEQRLDWSVANAFESRFFGGASEPSGSDDEPPSPADAMELPI